MYANSEDFQVLAVTAMVSSFAAEWNDPNMELHHEWKVMPRNTPPIQARHFYDLRRLTTYIKRVLQRLPREKRLSA